MRILIIGPSHTAALRTATPRVLQDYPDLVLDFFTAPGAIYRQFELDPVEKRIGVLSGDFLTDKETALLLKISGRTSISYNSYDAVVLAGHDIRETLNARILGRFSIDGTHHSRPSRSLSNAAYHAMLSELGHNRLPHEGWWHSDTPCVYVSPAPRIAETCVDSTSRTVAAWIPLVEKNLTTPAAFKIFPLVLKDIYHAHGMGFISNPEQTYGATGLTKKKYAKSAVYMHRADVRKESDSIHMNADFGTVCLRKILETILAQAEQTT